MAKYLYLAPEPHVCPVPAKSDRYGSIWQCTCGEYYQLKKRLVWFGFPAMWSRISAKKVQRVLAKISEADKL